MLIIAMLLSVVPLSSLAGGGNGVVEVTLADHTANKNKDANYIYFTVTPATTLTTGGWKAYYGSVISINGGTVRSDIPIRSVGDGTYAVDFYGTDLESASKEGMTVKIEGDLTDGTQTIRMATTKFVYTTDGMWKLDNTPDVTNVTLSDHAANARDKDANYIYFTVTPATTLTTGGWKAYYGSVLSVNGGTVRSDIPIRSVGDGVYVVDFYGTDLQSASKEGMTVRIEGDLTDGTKTIRMAATKFVYTTDGMWKLDNTPDVTDVSLVDHVANGNQDANYIYFTVTPAIELTTTGWTAYYGSVLSVNGGTVRSDIPIRSVDAGTYVVDLYGTDLQNASKDGMKVKLEGVLTDGTKTIRMAATEFQYDSTQQKWELYDPAQEPVGMTVTIDTDSRNKVGEKGIYFTVSPADELEYSESWKIKYYGECIYVDTQLKTNVPIIKIGPALYYLGLPDAGIAPVEGTKVKIDGEISDTSHKVEFTPATFVYRNSKWVLEGSVEDQVIQPATVQTLDIYEITNLSSVTLPGEEKNYNLGDLKSKSNVELAMQIDALHAPIVFGLSKDVANNVWVESGYLIEVNPSDGFIKILTGSGVSQATLKGQDFSNPFDFSYGVVDMYPTSGGTEPVARKVYVKKDGAEILSWLDWDMSRELGTYVPIWSRASEVLNSIDYAGYELKSKTPKIQDISGLIDGVRSFTTSPKREVMVGTAAGTTNHGIRMKVKWHKNKAVSEEGDELLLSFGNSSTSGIWMGEEGGYNILFTNTGIRVYHCSDSKVYESVKYELPQDEFLLEIGTYDRAIYQKAVKVKDHSRAVYVKIDGVEVLTFADIEFDRKIGKNLWVYTSEKVTADLYSLTSNKYLIAEKAVVSDLYNVAKVSRKTLTQGSEMYLGDMKGKTNVAFRTKVKVSKDCPEFYFGLSKADKRLWDIDESGWQFWLKPKTQQLFLVCDGSTICSLRAYEIPEVFVLEIGERDVRYNDGTRYAREIYITINGEEALTYMDKDFSRKLGTYMCTYVSKGYDVVLESLTTKGYVPTEKNVKTTDIYDASGYALMSLSEGLNYLGELHAEKNSAIKLRVQAPLDTEEFGISIGKAVDYTITEDVTDASVSGWNLWFRPKYDNIEIQYGYYKKGTSFTHDFAESFILEVGSRDVYYENGKYYGYEVYVKIDGKTVGSWLDDNVKKRTVGKHVMATLATVEDVTFETLYDTITLPVEYVVNGNVQDKAESVKADTKVVTGKPSKITITTHINAECKMYNRGVALNEESLTPLADKDSLAGRDVYEVTAKKGDKIVLTLEKRELTVDKASLILDMYDISGKQSLTVPGMLAGALGNMMYDGERARTNSALRFKVTMPQNGGSIRWSMYSDSRTAWGFNGFVAGLSNGKATLYSVTYNELAKGHTQLVSPGKTLYVECGMVKCYEDGNYKYNRFYIKGGESLDKLEQLCWYDSRERGGYGTTVSFLGMDLQADYTVHSTKSTYALTDISTQTNKDKLDTYEVYKETKVAVYYPERVVSYQKLTENITPAEIKIHPKDGKTLGSLIVNGQDVTKQVERLEDDSYSYRLPSVTGNVKFAYTIK